MEVAEQKFRPAALPRQAVSGRVVFLRHACPLILLGFLICTAFASRAGDIYDSTLERRFAEPKGSTNIVPETPGGTLDPNLVAIEQSLKAEQRARSEGPPVSSAEPVSRSTWMLLAAVLLAVILVFSKIIRFLNDRIKNMSFLSREAEEEVLREKLISEQPSLVAFFNELRYGLGTAVDPSVSVQRAGSQPTRNEQARLLQKFFDVAPASIAVLRAQLFKIDHAPVKVVRLELLREFFCQIDALKKKATLPELRPLWLMICGLEGLVQQLSMTAANINPSVLRTAAGAVDLMETLAVPGVDPNLATRTPVELLAADDNPVCLSALSLALKKAFREPDLAVDGVSGLALAEKKHYDVIFLDVEMPGMNGFELCEKIGETGLNQSTPVVFVTSHGDFNSRAKSTLVGGTDLIAKPYLSFEITVKALTLALRGRLANDKALSQSDAKEAAATPAILARPVEISA